MMKRIALTLAFGFCLMSAHGQKEINLGLIPTPQRVDGAASPVDLQVVREKRVKEVRVDTLPVEANLDQAYQLVVEKKGVTIRYVGEEGLRNAWLTLDQLKRLHGDKIPCCTITDWPAYKYRGWMDDISRGPVTHERYRQKQYEMLHALKYNFSNYYTEHTLYQTEFPDLAPAYAADCPPLADEVINLQLFAHAEKTLRVPYYQHIMDGKANFNPGEEETYRFLEQRIDAAFRRFPQSPFFIINCDETEQLGTGRAKALVESLGTDQVYVNHINRCYDIIKEAGSRQQIADSRQQVADSRQQVAATGYQLPATGYQLPATSYQLPSTSYQLPPRVVMWGDIVAKNPAMMRQLPGDMTYIMWAYEPLDSYDHLIKPFRDNGTPFWVAPSLSHSSNMIPNPHRYMKNIANLARDGFRNGAEGLMNTCWDDNGEALFDNCWHGLFWSAEMAWNPIRTDDPEEYKRREQQFNENFERLFYGNSVDGGSTAVKTTQLYALGALESDPDVADWYTSAALMEPLLNFNPDNTSDAMSDRCDRVMKKVIQLDKEVDSAANPHAHYALMRIRQTVLKSILRKMIYHQLEGTDSTMPERLKMMRNQYFTFLFDLKREYLRLWDQENGDYERHIVLNRYDDLAREVLELDRHVFITSANSSLLTPHSSFPIVTLRTLYNDRPIYYTLDGSEPTASSTRYTSPFPLEHSATIRAIAYNKYGEGVVSEQYLLSHKGMGAKIKLGTPFSTYKAIYSGGGHDALIDGQLGSNTTYADGHWQGYWGDSIDALISLTPSPSPGGEGSRYPMEISMRFMQNTFDWILAPTQIKVYTSTDGKNWTLVADKHFDMDPRETGMRLKNYTIPLTSHLSPFTFLRVVVPNPGPLPSWHPAPGQPSYLFTDEIVIK